MRVNLNYVRLIGLGVAKRLVKYTFGCIRVAHGGATFGSPWCPPLWPCSLAILSCQHRLSSFVTPVCHDVPDLEHAHLP